MVGKKGEKAKKGLLLILATAIISGISIFLNKFAVSGINADVFAFLKNIIVAVFLLSIILIFSNFKEIKNLTKKQLLKLSAIGLLGGSVPFILFFRGLKLVSSSSGSLIHKSMFLFVALFAVLFLKEKLNKAFFISALLLLTGNALLLGFYFRDIGKNIGFGYGEFLILTATLFWAAENTLSKHVLKELSGNIVAFGRMFFGSVFILVFLLFTKEAGLVTKLSISQLGWIAITSLLLFSYVITWYNGLKHVNVTTATQILLLGAPVTAILNLLFFSEAIAIAQGIGIALVLGAVLLALIFEIRKKSRLNANIPSKIF